METPKSPHTQAIALPELLQLRDEKLHAHPLIKDQVIAPTPAIKEAFDIVEDALIHYESGVCFIAESRFGKTFAINLIDTTVTQHFANVPRLRVNAKEHDHPTERALYTDLLLDLGHGSANTGTAIARRIRVFSLMLAAAQTSASDRILLFVDEAQNWKTADFTHMRDLSNDLTRQGISLVVVLFGHHQLNTLRTELRTAKRTDLIGRFLLSPYAFHGVRSEQDLLATLQCYDDPDIVEFPARSGVCISSFFLPRAYDAGWRIQNEARACWDAFETFGNHRTGHDAEIGMKWVGGAIRDFLCTHMDEDGRDFRASRDAWIQAVQRSGFEATLSQDPTGL
ncbi:ATP-binding protein [Pandoraea sp. XJJ-1]|uniref:ATP-binding protein n=1 Tax=Pandoraea sp. XJJ-1 TaxID=3002643 RepID=UPI002281E86A|nr:ATP-binding protein [Pandoraea sp. XJJ-1]WAL84947.1 ATP-binding protein [Pandoraea sp. XJJ-1]